MNLFNPVHFCKFLANDKPYNFNYSKLNFNSRMLSTSKNIDKKYEKKAETIKIGH